MEAHLFACYRSIRISYFFFSSSFNLYFIYLFHMHTCTLALAYTPEVRGPLAGVCSLFLICGSYKLNSTPRVCQQVCQQAPLHSAIGDLLEARKFVKEYYRRNKRASEMAESPPPVVESPLGWSGLVLWYWGVNPGPVHGRQVHYHRATSPASRHRQTLPIY